MIIQTIQTIQIIQIIQIIPCHPPHYQRNLAMVGGIVNMAKDVKNLRVTVFRILVKKMLTVQMLEVYFMDWSQVKDVTKADVFTMK